MTINMRTITKKVTNNYKSKRCKMKTTKIKITMTRRVVNNYSQEGASLKRLSFKRFNLRVVLATS